MFLYQLQPSFFYTRMDVFTWLFMQTGLHESLLNNKSGWILFDALFYTAPLAYFITYKYKVTLSAFIACIMLIINWAYVQCYTLYPSDSIEAHIPWLLFPLAFIPNNKKIFELLFSGLRYFFIFFFFSAAVWKFVQGGIFNINEMSGVLLYQHNQMLTNSPAYWQSQFLYWLIKNPSISFLFYLSAAILELFFVIGFFTKKFDRWLIICFILFLIMDYLIMRIPYIEMLPFLLTLYFSGSTVKESRYFSSTNVDNR